MTKKPRWLARLPGGVSVFSLPTGFLDELAKPRPRLRLPSGVLDRERELTIFTDQGIWCGKSVFRCDFVRAPAEPHAGFGRVLQALKDPPDRLEGVPIGTPPLAAALDVLSTGEKKVVLSEIKDVYRRATGARAAYAGWLQTSDAFWAGLARITEAWGKDLAASGSCPWMGQRLDVEDGDGYWRTDEAVKQLMLRDEYEGGHAGEYGRFLRYWGLNQLLPPWLPVPPPLRLAQPFDTPFPHSRSGFPLFLPHYLLREKTALAVIGKLAEYAVRRPGHLAGWYEKRGAARNARYARLLLHAYVEAALWQRRWVAEVGYPDEVQMVVREYLGLKSQDAFDDVRRLAGGKHVRAAIEAMERKLLPF